MCLFGAFTVYIFANLQIVVVLLEVYCLKGYCKVIIENLKTICIKKSK
jgi:hypothetical protein